MTAIAGRLTNIEGLKAELADNLAISTVAEHLGAELQNAGQQWVGLCLLHEENTPSMYFNDNKGPLGVFHCWGCKESGDAITLVQKVRNLSFIEALYYLAAEADVEISDYERPLTEAEKREEEFRSWCEDWLVLAPDLQLLPSRLDIDTGVQFGVVVQHKGSADTAPNSYLREHPYLCDGVILPWRTPSGRLVGWRVREHPGREKRVVGTPNDFPLGNITATTLFGIQQAREHIAAAGGRLIVVEGEYDTMALHAAGIQNVAGMGGSSLTEGQMKLLESLHVRELVAVFDGDEGGRKAAHAFAEKYWSHDIFVRVATCDAGYDPEDMVTKLGDFAFHIVVTDARSGLEYLLREEWARKGRDTLSDKLEFVRWIRETYGQRLRSTDESLVLAEVAKWLEVPELEIRDYVRSSDGALCAVDSERLLLGKACRDQKFYVHLRGRLAREDFFVLKHQRLWDVLADMLIDGQEFDVLTVVERAERQGVPPEYVRGCTELSDANSDHHIGVVADLALRRTTRDDVLAFRDRIADLNQPSNQLVGDLTHRITNKALRFTGAERRQLAEQVDQAMETLHERMNNDTEEWGIKLGLQLPRLSRILQGLQPGRLYQVAALSRRGKSTMLCQWAASIAVHQSIPLDFISLEMDEQELLYKIAAHMTHIDSTKIFGGRLEPQEARAVEFAMHRIRNSPLHIWCPDSLDASEFVLHCRESCMQRRTQAFFVDYLQLISPEPGHERDNTYTLFGNFARDAKMKVARGMETVVVCAAQLRRDAANKEIPTIEDFGDSYAVVRHSNVVLILSGSEDDTTLEMIVGKNRGGAGGGIIPTVFNRPVQTFREASGAPEKPEYAVVL